MGALILRSSSGNHYLKDKMMLGIFCISALIAVTAGQAPPPPGHVLPPPPPPPPPYGPPRPGYPMPMRHYGRPPMGPFGKRPGGGIDPLTLLAFGGLGGSGDNDDLLPLLPGQVLPPPPPPPSPSPWKGRSRWWNRPSATPGFPEGWTWWKRWQ